MLVAIAAVGINPAFASTGSVGGLAYIGAFALVGVALLGAALSLLRGCRHDGARYCGRR